MNEAQIEKPDNCCAEGCGKPTSSHNIAVDITHLNIDDSLPTLAGVVCHTCWSGGGETEAIEGAVGNHERLLDMLNKSNMVALPVEVDEI